MKKKKQESSNETFKIKCKFESLKDYKEEMKLRKEFIIELEKFSFQIVPGLGYGSTIYGLIPSDKLKQAEKIKGLTITKWD